MKVICAPNPADLDVGELNDEDLNFSMLQTASDPNHGTVGRSFRDDVRRQGLTPNETAWDFALLALAIIAADQGCLRSQSPDGWTREIELHVALVNPSTWTPHLDVFTKALQFLTGDIWSITLHNGGLPHLERTNQIRRPVVSGDCVCLLSGGLDSLIGGINLTNANHTPVFVSQVAKGDSDRQKTFAEAVGATDNHVQLSHAARVPGTAERSQRGRSIMFLALGALAASTIEDANNGSCRLIIPENGFISYNVPLTPLRIGSLSTRTTHPYFLGLIQQTWDAVGLNVQIENPYQHLTKGEMLSGCLDQNLLTQHASSSTSCGRFGRFGYQHCGRCVPCLVRRAAFIAWDQPDNTDYLYKDLEHQSSFDDVRSVAMACLQSQSEGILRWCGNALNSRYIDDVNGAADLINRGLQELRILLEKENVL